MNFKNDVEAVDALRLANEKLHNEVNKVIIGQHQVLREIIISIFSNGHCLLIGVPGLAKTLMITTIADALGLNFNRIQFTPDLMPSDIIGTEILDESRQFKFIKGPIFANFILADEINRTPPKTQSAMLEAMQERTVTASGRHFDLDRPFFVMATQNPIEQEGTYPLPEAQLDRFMFNILLDYPSKEEEFSIVKQTTSDYLANVEKIMSADDIVYFQDLIRRIPVNDNVIKYAVNLATATRPNTPESKPIVNEFINWGAGPRASQYLIIGAKTHAVLNGKYSPDIEDIQAVAKPIIRHRVVKNYKAEAQSVSVDDIVDELLKA